MKTYIRITVSIPNEFQKPINDAIQKYRYSSTSEFFRFLLRKWIENEEILKEKQRNKMHEAVRERTDLILKAIYSQSPQSPTQIDE